MKYKKLINTTQDELESEFSWLKEVDFDAVIENINCMSGSLLTWHNGTWEDGVWEWENGDWENGDWENGTWRIKI